MNYEDPAVILAFAYSLGMLCLFGLLVVEYIVDQFNEEE